MSDHDLILLATKYGSWFGNTLELRKEGLMELAKALYNEGHDIGYKAGYTAANLDAVDRGETKW